VAALLGERGLTHYYDLAGDRVPSVGAVPGQRGHAWLGPLLAATRAGGGSVCTVELDVQGIHCAACVWLMNETFRAREGAVAITVNPALGKVRLAWRRDVLEVADWIADIERFGYQLGPSRKQASAESSSLTWRMGLCVALTMNVMLFSLSFYFGLTRAEGDTYALFSRLSLALSTAVVLVGGWPFFRAAGAGLRRGLLHLDLPIALGILLVYATSLAEVARGRGGELTYFDTLNTFITLMVVGRYLQQRVLDRNRQYLLADDGADGIFVRRIEAGGLTTVAVPALRVGDRLLVAPGDLIPVDSELRDAEARVSTDWITGEARPRAVTRADTIPAGSFNAGDAAVTVVAKTDFSDSPLVSLLRQTATRATAGRAHLRFWDGLARRWVVTVLASATLGFAVWFPRDPGRALDVAVSLLVVTCPCAIGIALPLAYELVQSRLRRAGFFARSSDLLDRLERVRKLIFDKTGTLTLGRLELVDEGGLAALDPSVRDAAYNLACRSSHPVAACLTRALRRAGARYDEAVTAAESNGRGVAGGKRDGGGEWRLGRTAWAAPGAAATSATTLAHDGRVMATFELREAVRPDAREELAALRRKGYGVWLLSGDDPARVAGLARTLDLAPEHARGGRSPRDKADDVARLGGEDALYLGDGVNDALAFEQVLVAGSVAIDRPVLPGKSDFFLVGETLMPLGEALAAARRLRVVARRVLAIAIGYNVLAVSACLLGFMTPVRAAVFMPLSSLSVLTFTAASLRDPTRRRRARDRAAAVPAQPPPMPAPFATEVAS